ncbi:MAG: hypothetical protein AVDCRST_MAG08-2769, partial [uncultured Acetobacteraceae bacterium]
GPVRRCQLHRHQPLRVSEAAGSVAALPAAQRGMDDPGGARRGGPRRPLPDHLSRPLPPRPPCGPGTGTGGAAELARPDRPEMARPTRCPAPRLQRRHCVLVRDDAQDVQLGL